MEQLSGLDATFLDVETANAPMVGAQLAIYDPATAPSGRVEFADIVEYVRRRTPLVRTYRQRVVPVPLGLDHPYWVEDRPVDLEYHIRHVALPEPGSWRQLCTEAARLLEEPLDLSRPLWELYVIDGINDVEGVPPGSFALLTKGHHAATDGMAGVEFTDLVHEVTPDAHLLVADEGWTPEPEPALWELLARSAVNGVRRPALLARVVGRSVPAVARFGRELWRQRRAPVTVAPRTPFSVAVSPHRVVDGRRFDLAELRRIKATVDGATVNDVVLCVVAGALREYLLNRRELPDRSLVVMCPISVRSESERTAGGNQVTSMFVPLCTDIEDPVDRLAALRDLTRRNKAYAEAIGAKTFVNYADFVAGPLLSAGVRVASRLQLANRTTPFVNTTVTNMPGPQHPLYFSGARMVSTFMLGMIADGMAIIHPVMSYNGELTITFTADSAVMPDPAFYAECLQHSFEDLSKATRTETEKATPIGAPYDTPIAA